MVVPAFAALLACPAIQEGAHKRPLLGAVLGHQLVDVVGHELTALKNQTMLCNQILPPSQVRTHKTTHRIKRLGDMNKNSPECSGPVIVRLSWWHLDDFDVLVLGPGAALLVVVALDCTRAHQA